MNPSDSPFPLLEAVLVFCLKRNKNEQTISHPAQKNYLCSTKKKRRENRIITPIT